MAFLNRIGSVLKQAGIKQSELFASNSSLYQAIRCMSSAKLFIGGLSYGTDEVSLREAFSQYGEVLEARIIMDRETGRSRGFGFVSYTSSEQASSALQAMDGQDLHGRRVRVNYATDKPRAPGFGSYGGGPGFGGGNYGSGGSNYGGGNYGSGGSGYGGGNYGSGGSGGNYGSGGNSYGGGNYGTGGNDFGGGNYGTGGNDFGGGNYGSRGAGVSHGGGNDTGFGGENSGGFGGSMNSASYGVAGSGEKYFGDASPGGDSGMPSGGFGSTAGTPPAYGSGIDENVVQNGSLGGGNYRTDDGDDEPDDYANTRG